MHYPQLSPLLGKVGVVSNCVLPVLPSMVSVKRSDPVYMAHAYLTKVPVAGKGLSTTEAWRLRTGKSLRWFALGVVLM